jgi:hypothetical protein
MKKMKTTLLPNNITDIGTLIKAIATVLIKKKILIDSFNTTESPDLSVKGVVSSQRVFSLTFTEILRPSEIKKMMSSEGLPTVCEQIQKEYNRLLNEYKKEDMTILGIIVQRWEGRYFIPDKVLVFTTEEGREIAYQKLKESDDYKEGYIALLKFDEELDKED